MIWVTVEDVIAVHSRIIKASGGLDGIRDRNSLEAAVNAPLQTFAGFDLFETDLAKIARIGFGLASNHAFLDGNKRIGAMMTQLLLKWCGYVYLYCKWQCGRTRAASMDHSAPKRFF